MTNDVPSAAGHNFPQDDMRLSETEGMHALDDDVDPNREQTAHEERLEKLPPEEIDEGRTVGGGVMSEGGTAIERGTGTLSGEAQDRDVEADDENRRDRNDDIDDIAYPTEPGGGTH
jgi:hypothetical protein